MANKKRRKVRQPKKEFELYIIEIDSWEAPYFFGVNFNKDIIDGPFWEHASVKISGKFIQPGKIEEKAVSISVYGDRDITPCLTDPVKYDEYKPKAVGTLTVRGKLRDGSAWFPIDILPVIISMLGAERYRYIAMQGHALYRGHANIRSVSFHQEYDEDDW
ncbi:MAG: hypothetical protein ABFS18_11645 [Thermodesulfobacteriota bacterium]